MEREKIGTVLIILGILAWPVGLSLGIKPVPNILVPHLLGVIPGVYLRGSKILKKIGKAG
ncbi:MAG: hypothetical protein D6733_06815 [Methanobacteriota archaeon]|nr:MAG: hypothetical protein D6733_06815 [Euryarchaeota archaeon]